MTLLYLISHGHTARGVFQTGLLGKLRDSGFEVIVIAKNQDSALKQAVKDQNATIDYYSRKYHALDEQFTIFRNYINQNIRENPALWENHLRRVSDNSSSFKKRLVNQFYYVLGNSIRSSLPLKWLYNKIEKRIYSKPSAIELLKKYKPQAVISTRPVDSMEAEILNAATQLNILKIIYVLSWDNITSKGFFPVLADHYLTWGLIMNKELAEYYQVPEQRTHITGVTHFDIHAILSNGSIPSPPYLIEKLGLNNNRPYLFFTMSASYYAPNEIDIIEALAAKVEVDGFGSDMQLVIRPHMANLMSDRSDIRWLKRLENLVSNRVKVDFPDAANTLLTWYMKQDDMIRLSALLHSAAVCLNSGSTIAIEAVYLDRPVVLTPFDTEEWPYRQSARRLMDYIHLKKFVDTGACVVAKDLDDMYRAVSEYIKEPALNREQRKLAVELECYRNDGRATQRFVENIKKILAES